MRPDPGEVLHFSEDPTITRFLPHVASTARQRTPYVWAVDHTRSPDYWFPRACPRAMAWSPTAHPLLSPGTTRLHAIEYGWLEPLRTVRLYAYRLPATAFTPFGTGEPHAHVATIPITPLGPPEPVGDLLHLHEEAGIELRVLPTLWPLWDTITTSTLSFSGIRLGNALPRSP
ncbi:DUF6886 family protein [Umezawaea sp. NPDC059074]|uniref:DUF6886 family protein n=1 Tax=Umezawaea sp. NPDC059074 TaxID=3346716 RepID=UPI0036D02376